MDADCSVELGPEAPALELPWEDPEGRWHYVELRSELQDEAAGEAGSSGSKLVGIPEAQQFPALGRFLAEANSPQSAWQTAKCGVWAEQTDAHGNFYNAGFVHGCYVDLVLARPWAALRESLEEHQRLAEEMARMLGANESLEAIGEIVVRRCYFHREASPEESDAGYSLTFFLAGYGASADAALECWEQTLAFAGECLLNLQAGENSA